MRNKNKYFLEKCRLLLLVILVYSSIEFKGQIANYVSNGGFELCGNCINPTGPFKRPKDWNAIDSNQAFAVLLSQTLSPYAVPLNSYAYQWPRHGSNYIISKLYCSTCSYNIRGYPRNTLKHNLEAGKTYCFSMYVSLTNQSSYAIDAIGVYFGGSDTDTITQCTSPLTFLTQQIRNPVNNLITDTLNWILIRGLYLANGTEKYLIIGNFLHDFNTDTVLVNSTNLPNKFSDYCYDDVSCIDIDLPAFAGNDVAVIPGDSVYLGRESDVGIDEDCFWYKLPTVITPTTPAIDTIAGFWLKPTETCTYVVKQDVCGNVKWDTVVVSMNPVGIVRLSVVEGVLELFPIPAQDFIELRVSQVELFKEINSVAIYDNLGQLLGEQKINFENKSLRISTNDLPNGIYFIRLKSGNSNYVNKRFVISR